MSQQHEETIEDWWLKLRSKGVELFDHLCVDKLKVCCPENHFGPTCEPCTGHPDNVCNGHGRCNGSGTRNGTGACDCYAGYTSDQCQDCKSNYLRVDDKCEKCDSGCEDGCHSLGPKGCLSCAKGYYEHEELGCQDVNECLPVDNNPCASATMCVNTNGSYECMRKYFGLSSEVSKEEKNYKDCCSKYCN